MKFLTWQNPEQLFVAQELINKVKSKCCGIKENVYEFKKNDIRVYVILERPDVFVILGAYKSNQDLDIKKIDKLFNGFEM